MKKQPRSSKYKSGSRKSSKKGSRRSVGSHTSKGSSKISKQSKGSSKVNINVIRASANYSSGGTMGSGLTDKYSFFESYRSVKNYESVEKGTEDMTKLERVRFLLDWNKQKEEEEEEKKKKQKEEEEKGGNEEEERAKDFGESVPTPSKRDNNVVHGEIVIAENSAVENKESGLEKETKAGAQKQTRDSRQSQGSKKSIHSGSHRFGQVKRGSNYSSKRGSKRKIRPKKTKDSKTSKTDGEDIENNFSSQKMSMEMARESEITMEEQPEEIQRNDTFNLSEQLVNLRLSKQVDPELAGDKDKGNSFVANVKRERRKSNFRKKKPSEKIGYPEDSQNINDVIGTDYKIQEAFKAPKEINELKAAGMGKRQIEKEPTTENEIQKYASNYVSNIKTEIINEMVQHQESGHQNEISAEADSVPDSEVSPKSPGPKTKPMSKNKKLRNRLIKRNKTKEKKARDKRLKRLNASRSRNRRVPIKNKSQGKAPKPRSGNAHVPMNAYKRNREKSTNVITSKNGKPRFQQDIQSPTNSKNDFYEKLLNPKDPMAEEVKTPTKLKSKKLSGKVKNTVNRLYKVKTNSRAARGQVAGQKDSITSRSRYTSSGKKGMSIGSLPSPSSRGRSQNTDPKKLWKNPQMKDMESKVKQMIKSKKRRVQYQDERVARIDEKLRSLEEERRKVAALQFELNRLKFLIAKEDKMKTMRDPEQEKKDMEDRWSLRQKLIQARTETRKAEKQFMKKIREDGWDDLRNYKKTTHENKQKTFRDKVQDVRFHIIFYQFQNFTDCYICVYFRNTDCLFLVLSIIIIIIMCLNI